MGRSALVAFVTSVITTFVAFAALTLADRRGMLDFLHGGKGEVEVPSINGLSVEQGRDLLRANDLLLTLQAERPDPAIPAGTPTPELPETLVLEGTIDDAIRREKLLKTWKRAWKIKLIEQANPEWRDLFSEMYALRPIRASR